MITPTPTCPAPSDAATTQQIWRFQPGAGWACSTDAIAGEAPLEIRVRGKAVCITMRTPQSKEADRDLAAGFLLSEGVVRHRDDVLSIEPCTRNSEGHVINVFLAPRVQYDEAQLTRHVFASSSCGICGKASIDAILADFEPLLPPTSGGTEPAIEAARLTQMPERLRAHQVGFDATGGLHAAAVFTFDGELLVACEDIGRHNAVDKALGKLLLAGSMPLSQHVLVVSGRVSFEIMQKALAAKIPVVAAVSAPSSLAVAFAQDSGQTLAGFVRDGRMNVYTHPERIACWHGGVA